MPFLLVRSEVQIKVIEISVNDLRPYANNPRVNDKAVPAVMESIRSFGFKVPLVVDKNNVVINGHTRLKAALRLGMEKVPCVIADDLDERQAAAFRLADNRVAEIASWDKGALDAELQKLINLDGLTEADFLPDLETLGFDLEKEIFLDLLPADNNVHRTADKYNLDFFNAKKAVGWYDMPLLKKCDTIPEYLVDFVVAHAAKGYDKKAGVHFYIDDYRFERVWEKPQEYIKKLTGFACVLTPDFSLYADMPRAMKIWNVYRSRLIGQMMQDAGLNVIPTLSWCEKETFDFCFDGIEPGGVVSVSTIGVKKDEAAFAIWKDGMDEAIKSLSPSCVLVYGGKVDYAFPCAHKWYENATVERMKKSRKEKKKADKKKKE